jgi:hypothetical protein
MHKAQSGAICAWLSYFSNAARLKASIRAHTILWNPMEKRGF